MCSDSVKVTLGGTIHVLDNFFDIFMFLLFVSKYCFAVIVFPNIHTICNGWNVLYSHETKKPNMSHFFDPFKFNSNSWTFVLLKQIDICKLATNCPILLTKHFPFARCWNISLPGMWCGLEGCQGPVPSPKDYEEEAARRSYLPPGDGLHLLRRFQDILC